MEQLTLDILDRTDSFNTLTAFQISNKIVSMIQDDCKYDSGYLKTIRVEEKAAYCSIMVDSLLMLRVSVTKNKKYISLKKYYLKDIGDRLNLPIVSIASEPDFERYEFATVDELMQHSTFFKLLFEVVLSSLPGEKFGCCHRYIECSDNLRCLHPDKIRARACYYRKNLEAGRVFYGINKNI